MRKVLISAAGVLMAGLVLAQPRGSMAAQPWWENRPLVTSLNLSEAQTKQLTQVTQAYVNRLMDLRAAVTKADHNLDEVFNQATMDEVKAEAAVDQYADARANMTRELTHLSLKMRSVLTAEQWEQLVNLQNGRGGNRQGQGRGRRGGPPVTQPSAPSTSPSKVGPALSQSK